MEGYIGQILLFAGLFAPNGWHFCDGSLLSINSNEAFYSIVGTTYGGDGRSTFGLPNLPPVKNTGEDAEIRYIICAYGIFPTRP